MMAIFKMTRDKAKARWVFLMDVIIKVHGNKIKNLVMESWDGLIKNIMENGKIINQMDMEL